jgi:monothiol glutaredoxin
LFINGSAAAPRSGYSRRAVEVLSQYPIIVHTVDAFSSAELRLSLVSNTRWPTIPQLFVRGEFIGGSDLLIELDRSGELTRILGCVADPAARTVAAFLCIATHLPPRS